MSAAPRELLVILDPHPGRSALERLRAIADVTQVMEPRLALVQGDAATAARIADMQGVVGVHDGALGPIPSDLTPTERLFVSAWEARQRPKERRGEGLDWDTPGFEPPDSPADR